MSQLIQFDQATDTAELDLSNLTLEDNAAVDRLYDELEWAILDTGQPKWFMLINLRDFRVYPEAWIQLMLRSKRLTRRFSAGTVRFDASEETLAEIERRSEALEADPNLLPDRETALARLDELRRLHPIRKRVLPSTDYTTKDFAPRVRFDIELETLELDFSHFHFGNSADVNAFYDYIEHRVAATGRKWYFLVNFHHTQIDMAAWLQYGARGKRLSSESSLGTVHYNNSATSSGGSGVKSDPNICGSRMEALARVYELRREALASASDVFSPPGDAKGSNRPAAA